MGSGQNMARIKKSIFIPFLTEERKATFTTRNIRQSFSSTRIYPLNARPVLDKLAPNILKRHGILGIIKSPSGSREIQYQVQALGLLLDKITIGVSHPTMDQVRGIMSSLGYQLEEEIASREWWRELSQKHQTGDKHYNETDRRRLSEARLVDGETLM